ncbi:serine hydrolase domain-containing protein [Sphingosinicella rhizophila]|uniref:Serine hydrolase domain-containing protein n=1 Tax=Sphingosinicella rhizophila TaxID=3050082 RepID=A0ABU3Q5B1_9SPHN|nr:serine hydrolase domain-containing protein [Sphingosinicella sp. GR2756]MDT9598153.1 serine hydrolase domain-containing protein [Sphingosinicella sp. GR2756]
MPSPLFGDAPAHWRQDRRQFLAMLGAAAVLPGLHAGGPAFAFRRATPDYPATKAVLDRYVAERKVPNAVAAIGRAGAAPSFLQAGTITLDGSVPAGPDTLYRVYSMTKPVTGIAAMMLVEDGKLKLDQPLADIFPEFGRMNVLTDAANSLDARPATNPILIRHLLTHTAGLSYDIMGDQPLMRLYREEGIMPHQGLSDEPPKPRPANLTAFARKVASVPLLFEPGTTFFYSIGLDIAGAVIERVSGQSFETFLERRLFDPLGMRDSFFTVPQDKIGRLGPVYVDTPQGIQPKDAPPDSVYARAPAFAYGGAGLVSSPRDFDRFLAMLLGEGILDGVRVMKTETARQAMSNLLPAGVPLPEDFGGGGFGAGGRVSLADEASGQGAGTYGWGGAAGTIAWVDRKHSIRASGYIQKFPPGQDAFGNDLVPAIYRDLG